MPIVFDDFSSGHRSACKWGEVIAGDIRDKAALRAAFTSTNPVAVLHLAARIEVEEAERNPTVFDSVNVHGTENLLQTMVAFNISNIVFSSTGAVYGAPKQVPISEKSSLAPKGIYSATKAKAEGLLQKFAQDGSIRHGIFRYFNAAGAHPDGDIGEEHNPETHLIPNALAAASGGSALQLFGDDYSTPDGTCIRDYVHVCDIANAHILALLHLMQGGDSFVVNIGTGMGSSVLEVINAVERATGKSVPYSVCPKRAGDVPILVADTHDGKQKLGFHAEFPKLEQMVEHAWKYYQNAKSR